MSESNENEHRDTYSCDQCGHTVFRIDRINMPYCYYDYIIICTECGFEERIQEGGYRGI